jgi:hypothetical protein
MRGTWIRWMMTDIKLFTVKIDIMGKKVMINLTDERPFALFDNRFFLSVDDDGRADMIVKGNMPELESALLMIMRDHGVIAEFILKVAHAYVGGVVEGPAV